MYVCLTISALMGISESNRWAFNYFSSFSLDFFMINPIVNFIKVSLYEFSIKSTTFIAKIIYKLLKNQIENALKDEINWIYCYLSYHFFTSFLISTYLWNYKFIFFKNLINFIYQLYKLKIIIIFKTKILKKYFFILKIKLFY